MRLSWMAAAAATLLAATAGNAATEIKTIRLKGSAAVTSFDLSDCLPGTSCTYIGPKIGERTTLDLKLTLLKPISSVGEFKNVGATYPAADAFAQFDIVDGRITNLSAWNNENEDVCGAGANYSIVGRSISYIYSGCQQGGGVEQYTTFYEGKVQAYFINGALVPEPTTWAMMIGGIGMVGGVARRRRTLAANASLA